MKQLIVAMAVLPILIVFMVQFMLDQKNQQIIGAVQSCTYAAKERAKQEGCFTPQMIEDLKRDISDRTGLNMEAIECQGDSEVKSRFSEGEDRFIYYKVKVKIKGIMAGAGLFSSGKGEDSMEYVIDSFTASERV